MPQTSSKTSRGKAASSRNAWKHGILTVGIVLDEAEDPAEWKAHVAGIFESLQPEGHLEHILAERIAICLWKMRRVDYYQAMSTGAYMARAESDVQLAEAYRQGTLAKGIFPEVSHDEVHPIKQVRILPPTEDLAKTVRYESHLHRLWVQTLHELEAMQTRRRGGTTPLSRLDITGAPGG